MFDNIRGEIETILILVVFQLAVPKLVRAYSLGFDRCTKYFNLGKDEILQPSSITNSINDLLSNTDNVLVNSGEISNHVV